LAQKIQEATESSPAVPFACRGGLGALAPWQVLNHESLHHGIIDLLQADMLITKPVKEVLDDLGVGLNAGQHMTPAVQMKNKILKNYAEMNRCHPTSHQHTPEEPFQHREPPRANVAQGDIALNEPNVHEAYPVKKASRRQTTAHN
jgi:hypothetical protein